MKKKMRYLAIAAAIAVLMSAGGCSKQGVMETATDVAAVESVSDIVTTTVGTEQTTTVSSTSAQEEITLVTATEPTTAEKAVETAKTTQNTTKKTTAKAATAKTTVKTTAKKTTAKPQPKTTAKATTKATTKQSGLTKADYDWVLEEGIKYIKSLPKAKIDSSAAGYSFEGITSGNATSRKELLMHIKEAIDLEYNDFVGNGGIGMNLSLKSTGESYPYPQYEYVLRYITYLN